MAFTHYRQYDAMDCGPTCLKMVARHYGKNFDLQLLREYTEIGKEGVSFLGLSEAAEKIGFQTKGVKLSFEQLTRDAPLPAILFWMQSHFVVLYKVRKNKLFIADPAAGLITLAEPDFKRIWISDKTNGMEEGVALLLEPTPKLYGFSGKPAQGPDKFRSIFSYLLPFKSLFLQLLIGVLISSTLQLALPFLTQTVVDVGISTENLHFVYVVLLAQLALLAGRMVIDFVRSWILLHISTRINISILTDFLIKLMKLPIHFFDSKKTGDILQRMSDHSRIEDFLTGSSLNTLFSLLNLSIFSVVLIIYNPFIFSVFLVLSILYAVWVILFLRQRKRLDYKRFDISVKEQALTIQIVQGMQEIKLQGCEKSLRWSWEALQAKLFRLNMKSLSLVQIQQSGGFFINEGKNILITFLSASEVINGNLTLGSMLAIQYVIGQLNSPVEQLIVFVQNWQNAKISFERLREIHRIEDEEPETKPLLHEIPALMSKKLYAGTPGTLPLSAGKYMPAQLNRPIAPAEEMQAGYTPATAISNSDIRLRNVSFTYSGAGNTPVLQAVDLDIPYGKTTAIVGLSGSGKTTLLKLLLKFYEPQVGELFLGDIPFSAISHKAWRRHCGVVMQDSYIFDDSIARNIAVGVEEIDLSRLNMAAAIANINEFIAELPLGYNTNIGSEGSTISMGQKQRILIARAVYRDPDFLFFDEATNSLDAENEGAISRNIEQFVKGKTVVIVAHRLSTVRNADQIVVLQKGKIIEKGSHQQLVALKGSYYSLVKNQLELGI